MCTNTSEKVGDLQRHTRNPIR